MRAAGVPEIQVSAPVVSEIIPATFSIPISVSDVTGKGVIAFQFHLLYDPTVIDPSGPNFGCSTAGTISETAGLTATCNIQPDGTLKVSVAGALPLSGSGTILTLNFTTDAAAIVGTQSPLHFDETAFFNTSGEITSAATDGLVTLIGPQVQFASPLYIDDESQTAEIAVSRTGDVAGTTTVTFATSVPASSPATPGTCGTGGADYVAVDTTVTFNPGEVEVLVPVTLCGDVEEEVLENVDLELSNVSIGSVLGAQSTAVLQINDTANQFRSTTPISFTGGSTPDPYPATISVSGAPTVNGGMRVTLFDVTHASPGNLDILLVGPLGQKMIIMGDAGGSAVISNPTTITFEDAAGAVLPQSTLITTGKYEPTTWVAGQANFAAPAPAGPYSEPGSVIGGPVTFASVFGTSNPNGQWQLFVRDDGSPNFAPLSNQIAGGWGLQFNVPTAADVTLSGRVMFGERGVRNAQITVTGGSLASPLVVQTGRNGEYTVSGLTAGETYVVTAAARRSTFPQPTRVVTLTDNLAGIDFNAETLWDR